MFWKNNNFKTLNLNKKYEFKIKTLKFIKISESLFIILLITAFILEVLLNHLIGYYTKFSKILWLTANIFVYISILFFIVSSIGIHIIRKIYLTLAIELLCCVGMLISRFLYLNLNMGREFSYLYITLIVILFITRGYNVHLDHKVNI